MWRAVPCSRSLARFLLACSVSVHLILAEITSYGILRGVCCACSYIPREATTLYGQVRHAPFGFPFLRALSTLPLPPCVDLSLFDCHVPRRASSGSRWLSPTFYPAVRAGGPPAGPAHRSCLTGCVSGRSIIWCCCNRCLRRRRRVVQPPRCSGRFCLRCHRAATTAHPTAIVCLGSACCIDQPVLELLHLLFLSSSCCLAARLATLPVPLPPPLLVTLLLWAPTNLSRVLPFLPLRSIWSTGSRNSSVGLGGCAMRLCLSLNPPRVPLRHRCPAERASTAKTAQATP